MLIVRSQVLSICTVFNETMSRMVLNSVFLCFCMDVKASLKKKIPNKCTCMYMGGFFIVWFLTYIVEK